MHNGYIIHTFDDARRVLEKYGSDVWLLSFVGAGVFQGASYWATLLTTITEQIGIKPIAVLHCSDNIGAVQISKFLGLQKVVYTGKHDLSYLCDDTFEILKDSIYG